jgi:hypothetical protein
MHGSRSHACVVACVDASQQARIHENARPGHRDPRFVMQCGIRPHDLDVKFNRMDASNRWSKAINGCWSVWQ